MIVKRPDNFFPDLRGFVDMASEGTQAMKEKIAGVFCRSAPVSEQERVAPPILVGAEEVQANTLEEATPQRPLLDIVRNGSLQELEKFYERGGSDIGLSSLRFAQERVLSEKL